MKRKTVYIAGVFIMLFVISVGAKTPSRHSKKAIKVNFKLLEAYTQKTVGGIPGAPSPTTNHFIVLWEAAGYPETFFWRGANGFLMCKIERAHKIGKKQANNYPPGMEYATENISGGKIHKGDTLEITPVTGGKYAVPQEVAATAQNTLYYKTGGSGWLSFPVMNIIKKQDLVMQ